MNRAPEGHCNRVLFFWPEPRSAHFVWWDSRGSPALSNPSTYLLCRADHFRSASSVYSTCFSGLSDL